MYLTTLFRLHTLDSIVNVLKMNVKDKSVKTGRLDSRDVFEVSVCVCVCVCARARVRACACM